MACAHCGRAECDGICQAPLPAPREKADTLPDEEDEEPPDWADVVLGEQDEPSERPKRP
jgi:hypothetical protein